MNDRTYTVYQGSLNGQLVYIGTTVQKPSARFRWHKANGKDLEFKVLAQFKTPEEMLDYEFELIKKLKPQMNKITKRKQNLNVKLTQEQLNARIGMKQWCQKCFRRRVNSGYTYCMFC